MGRPHLFGALLALGIACAPAPPGGEGRDPAAPPSSARPSVVVVSLDTLRADRLGCYGDERGLTPNLDRFAAEALLFENAFSQSNNTVQSHASLFTSRYPSELCRLGPAYRLGAGSPPTLAEVLSAYGYQAGAFVAGGHLDPSFGLDAGFQEYAAPAQWGSLYHTWPLALKWLDRVDPARPTFLFLHGYDTHARYVKPTPFG